MAAKNGNIILGTGPLRKTLSIYADDTAGHAITFSSDGKADANAPTFYIVPKPGWFIMDLTLEAATGQTTTTVKVNDLPVAVLLNANYLASITTRPPLGIVLNAGDKLSLFQVA